MEQALEQGVVLVTVGAHLGPFSWAGASISQRVGVLAANSSKLALFSEELPLADRSQVIQAVPSPTSPN